MNVSGGAKSAAFMRANVSSLSLDGFGKVVRGEGGGARRLFVGGPNFPEIDEPGRGPYLLLTPDPGRDGPGHMLLLLLIEEPGRGGPRHMLLLLLIEEPGRGGPRDP